MMKKTVPPAVPPARPDPLIDSPSAPGSRERSFSLRVHISLLVVICAIGLARGVFWVLLAETWSPIDEAQHYAYVESLASGQGLPEVGRDLVSLDVLHVAKSSPTLGFMSQDVPLEQDVSAWRLFAHQYEAVHGPVYYSLLVPVYLASRPSGVLTSLFAMRAASVVISLAAVPMLWLLSRELFPKRPSVWLAAPGLLVMSPGFNGNLATIGNDALVVPLAVAALYLAVRSARDPWAAYLAGAALGLSMLNKMTTAPLALLMVAGLLMMTKRSGWSVRLAAAPAIRMTAIGGALVLPWLARNLFVYGSYSPSGEIAQVGEGMHPELPLNLEGLSHHVRNSRVGFWSPHFAQWEDAAHEPVWWLACTAALVFGVVWAWRRRTGDAGWMLWLAAALPVGFLYMLSMVYLLFSGLGTVMGRHLYPALGSLMLLLAAGATEASRRWGLVALAGVVVLSLALEPTVVNGYAEASYTSGVLDETLVPVVDQSWNDGHVLAEVVEARVTCPVVAIGLVPEPVASTVSVQGSGSPVEGTFDGHDGPFAIYALSASVQGDIRVRLPDVMPLRVAAGERDPNVQIPGAEEDPMSRMYCASADPLEERFAAVHGAQHPGVLTLDRIRTWNMAWLGAGILLLLIAGGWALRSSNTSRPGAS